jgi:hypothetical protein
MSISIPLRSTFHYLSIQRRQIFDLIIITALISFEIFNYSTTEFALTDLLGNLRFAGFRWSTILAIAFCGIDYAGLAHLLTPKKGWVEPLKTWYLFSAWLLAATMNAILTWWGISIAILYHDTLGNAFIPKDTMLTSIPIFIAIIVWLLRVLIIGTFSGSGTRLLTQVEKHPITHPVEIKHPSIILTSSSIPPKRVSQTTTAINTSIYPRSNTVQNPEPIYTSIDPSPVQTENIDQLQYLLTL